MPGKPPIGAKGVGLTYAESPRTIKRLTVSTAAGSDPDVIESLDDCKEAYGDWPDILEICESPNNPGGQCEYAAWFFNHTRCIHCQKGEGV